MLKKLLNHKLRVAVMLVLVVFLILVRLYEDTLFYDPFLNYFKMDYMSLSLPEINNIQLFLGLSLRYFLNTFLSLAIIYTAFKDWELTKFAALLYFILFTALIFAFFLVLYFEEPNKMTLFYIRRFLIQPLFLLVFMPAFYYQEKTR